MSNPQSTTAARAGQPKAWTCYLASSLDTEGTPCDCEVDLAHQRAGVGWQLWLRVSRHHEQSEVFVVVHQLWRVGNSVTRKAQPRVLCRSAEESRPSSWHGLWGVMNVRGTWLGKGSVAPCIPGAFAEGERHTKYRKAGVFCAWVEFGTDLGQQREIPVFASDLNSIARVAETQPNYSAAVLSLPRRHDGLSYLPVHTGCLTLSPTCTT